MNTTLLEETRVFLAKTELKQNELVALQDILRQHNHLYYVQSQPLITDSEYDQLFALLIKSEEKYGVFDPLSPTKRIDVLLSQQFEKVAHKFRLFSLDNTYDAQDVAEFDKRIKNILKTTQDIPYVIELKFDGLGIALTYKDGKLYRAATRGNGLEGEDITANAFQIASIPKTISALGEIEIRGEVIMPRSVFALLNERQEALGERVFANPRNAASGSLRQLDPSITRDRSLAFYAYSFPLLEDELSAKKYSEEQNIAPILSYTEVLSELKRLGFLITPYCKIADNIEEVIAEIQEKTAHKPVYDFDIDGLVLKVNTMHLWQEIGFTEHHPRSAIAYKFPAQEVDTVLLAVEHSVGRTGVVTPIAQVQPTEIGGVVVSRVTLHNYEEMERKGLKIKDTVVLVRAGEVIPEIVGVHTEKRTGEEVTIEIPTHCPSCGSALKKEEGKVALFCPNVLTCPSQIQGRLEFFVSKGWLEIEGIGKKQIALFLLKGLITDMVSLFFLSQHKETILSLPGFKDKSVDNIINAIQKAKTQPLWRFLSALGIPLIGKKAAKLIAQYTQLQYSQQYPQDEYIIPENLLRLLRSFSTEDIESIHEIGTIGARSFVEYIAREELQIQALLSVISIEKEKEQTSVSQQLAQKSFCITGSFEGYSRQEITGLIEAHGGSTKTSVSKNLHYLIAGENAWSKLAEAQKLHIDILTLEDFFRLIGE